MKVYRRISDKKKFGLLSEEKDGEHFNVLVPLNDREQPTDAADIPVPDDFDDTYQEVH